MKPIRIAITFVGSIGIFFLIISFMTFHGTNSWLKNTQEVTGFVTEIVYIFDGDSITYTPTFEYQDTNGLEHTINSTVSSFSKDYKKGQLINVLYSLDNPDDAIIEGFYEKWGISFVLSLFGIFAFILLPIEA